MYINRKHWNETRSTENVGKLSTMNLIPNCMPSLGTADYHRTVDVCRLPQDGWCMETTTGLLMYGDYHRTVDVWRLPQDCWCMETSVQGLPCCLPWCMETSVQGLPCCLPWCMETPVQGLPCCLPLLCVEAEDHLCRTTFQIPFTTCGSGCLLTRSSTGRALPFYKDL